MLFWVVAAVIFIIDRSTKYLVVANMSPGQSIPILENIFHLTYVLNPGAAFGLFAYQTMFFILIAVLVVGVILYFNWTLPAGKQFLRIGLALQLGGSLGNLLDRIQSGYVVDFFDFRVWPVFNIADIAIVTGVVILAYEILRTDYTEDEKDEDLIENGYNKG
ncbi:MAG: signal peptidase II [Bacillota bacterium]|nr:signal peptidase II [Bacillota bacterium]